MWHEGLGLGLLRSVKLQPYMSFNSVRVVYEPCLMPLKLTTLRSIATRVGAIALIQIMHSKIAQSSNRQLSMVKMPYWLSMVTCWHAPALGQKRCPGGRLTSETIITSMTSSSTQTLNQTVHRPVCVSTVLDLHIAYVMYVDVMRCCTSDDRQRACAANTAAWRQQRRWWVF